MPRDSAAADRPASYLVGTAAAFPLFFRDRTKPINQLPFSPSAKFPKSGSSCESRASQAATMWQFTLVHGLLIGGGTSASFGPVIADISHALSDFEIVAVCTTRQE